MGSSPLCSPTHNSFAPISPAITPSNAPVTASSGWPVRRSSRPSIQRPTNAPMATITPNEVTSNPEIRKSVGYTTGPLPLHVRARTLIGLINKWMTEGGTRVTCHGLSIAKCIVDVDDRSIAVSSRPLEGTAAARMRRGPSETEQQIEMCALSVRAFERILELRMLQIGGNCCNKTMADIRDVACEHVVAQQGKLLLSLSRSLASQFHILGRRVLVRPRRHTGLCPGDQSESRG
jgi:hypothetical protein